MKQVFRHSVILDTLMVYINRLSALGYAKHSDTVWQLCYLFLIDLFLHSYKYFTDDDYRTLNLAFIKLFDANCSVSYPDDGEFIGKLKEQAIYSGTAQITMTGTMRKAETGKLRRVE